MDCSISIAVINTSTKIAWGGKDLFSLHLYIIVQHWRKSRNSIRAEPEDKSWLRGHTEVLAYRLVPPSLLSYRTRIPSSKVAPAKMAWNFTHQSPRNCPIVWHTDDHMETFATWGSVLSDNFSFCQVVITLYRTTKPLSSWHTNTSLFNYNLSFFIYPKTAC